MHRVLEYVADRWWAKALWFLGPLGLISFFAVAGPLAYFVGFVLGAVLLNALTAYALADRLLDTADEDESST